VSDAIEPGDLLAAYDAQLRAWLPEPLPATWTVDWDGPVFRIAEPGQRGFVGYRDLGGLDGPELDALIARQRDHFAARGEAVEWKLHGHDQPADLPARLGAAGFVPEEQETVVIGRAAPLAAAAVPLDPEVRLREVTARADLERISAMESAVWDEDREHIGRGLESELAANPQGLTVVVAEVGDTVVCAGWIRYVAGTAFGTLWGGSTLAEHRGRGIYSAVVVHRARLAVARGYSMLQVDASDDSRPILQRRGFTAVTTTTPYVFTP
jgi:hypothetical protein